MPHTEPETTLSSSFPSETRRGPGPRGGAAGGRVRVLRAVEASPGLGFRELARRTGIAAGTLAHHMAVLQRAGSVWTMRHGSRVLHFPAPRLDAPAPVRDALEEHVLDALDRDLLAWLREAPRVQKAVLARFAGHARATVQHRLARLVQWGFLTVQSRGRFLFYAVA